MIVSSVSRSPITSSTCCLIGAVLPLRRAPSTVISAFASENSIRSAPTPAEKPPKTTLWIAPMRAQASIATATSGIIGRKIPTTSPAPMPRSLSALAKRWTSREQLGVGDVALLALLAPPVEGDAVAAAGLHVAVEAVVGDVQLAAHEPLGERRVRPVEHLVPGFGPSAAPRPARPRSPRGRPRPPRRPTGRRRAPAPGTRPGAGRSPARAAARAPGRASRRPPSASPPVASRANPSAASSAFSAPSPVSERTNSSGNERSVAALGAEQRAERCSRGSRAGSR